MVEKPPSRYPWRSFASGILSPECSRSSCKPGERRIEVYPERNDNTPPGRTREALASVWTCSGDRFAISTWPAWPAGIVDRRRCSQNTTAAHFARPPANSPVRLFAADASAGSADADASSGRAAARIADSDGDFDFGGAAVEDFGSSGSSAASRFLLDVAARTDRAVFACLAPEATDRIVNNELPLSKTR